MRNSLLLLVMLAASGCTVRVGSDDASALPGQGAAGGGPAATGGSAGQAAGQAGGAGQPGGGSGGGAGSGDACNGVPLSGRCTDDTHFERCMPGEVGPDGKSVGAAQVLSGACSAGQVCKESNGWAGCKPAGECSEGSSFCDGPGARKVCAGGAWKSEACGAEEECQPSLSGVSCAKVGNQAGELFPIKGRLLYEYRPMKEDRTGYGDLTTDYAKGVIVLAYDGDEYLGGVYTSGEDGTFSIPSAKKPTKNTSLFFIPMLYDEGGTPQFAVAVPSDDTSSKASQYYSFGRTTGEALDVGDQTVTEAEGSGAIHIHQWILYSILQLRQEVPDKKPFNVVALWSPGKRFKYANGTFYSFGTDVDYGAGVDHYEGTVALAGTEASPHHWSSSVLLHEFGHYTMAAYSLSPHEAGIHSLGQLEKPGMAWSEGWATYLGQSMKQDPIYFDRQEGTTWWFNVAEPGSRAPALDPDGGIDQEIGEANVSKMLWHLDDPADDSWDKSALGQTPVVQAFASERVTNSSLNRGYTTVDFLDFLDALRCNGAASADVLSITSHENFPYDDKPTCAK